MKKEEIVSKLEVIQKQIGTIKFNFNLGNFDKEETSDEILDVIEELSEIAGDLQPYYGK